MTLRDDEEDIIKGNKGGGFKFEMPKPGNTGKPGNTIMATPTTTSTGSAKSGLDRMAAEYGQDKIQEITGAKDRSNSIILGMNQLDDEAICEILERNPTYRRERKIVDAVRSAASDSSQSSPMSGTSNAVFSY